MYYSVSVNRRALNDVSPPVGCANMLHVLPGLAVFKMLSINLNDIPT